MGAVEKHDGFAIPGRVVLAHELPFTLGLATISPSLREIRNGERRETVEPRVMQVLVALARASGEIVTRDELIATCWDGRIVGDDSVNRVMSRIRKIAEGIGCGSFHVETVPRVGYRLKIGSTGEAVDMAEAPIASADVTPPIARRPLLQGFGSVAAVAAIGAGAWIALPRVHEPDPAAQRFYERGIAARGQNALASAEQAVAYFRQATRIDPAYAQAWGALAWGYRSLLEYGPRSDAANLTMLARSAAARALELEPNNPDARAAVLLLKPFFGNWAEIERGCEALLAKHPDHSITQYNLAFVKTETGRWREALPHYRKLAEREPFWPLARMQLFRTYLCTGRLEEAEEQIETALRLWPRQIDVWTTRLRHLLITGRSTDALALLKNDPARPVDFDHVLENERLLARAYIEKSPELRRTLLNRLLDATRANPREIIHTAVDAAFLGEVDTAFALLEGYYFGTGTWAAARVQRPATTFLFNMMMTNLRRDSRFEPLLASLGLDAFWRSTGNLPDFRRT